MSFDLASRLNERRAAHLYRQRPLLETPQGPEVMVEGERLLAFCSNDYLGLANHPEVIAAMQQNYDWFNHYIFGDPLPASGTGAW